MFRDRYRSLETPSSKQGPLGGLPGALVSGSARTGGKLRESEFSGKQFNDEANHRPSWCLVLPSRQDFSPLSFSDPLKYFSTIDSPHAHLVDRQT